VERLVAQMPQPRRLLRGLSVDTLRALCRDIGSAVSGSKDDLVVRIIGHMAADRDLIGEPEPPPAIVETRRLTEERFTLLFTQLRGHELAGILGEFELRRWGPKDLQIRTLWEAQRAEETLLGCLSNPELDVILKRVDLKPGGSKAERIERLVAFFSTLDEAAFRARQSIEESNFPG